MHEMETIVTDDLGVSLSVSHAAQLAKMAVRVKMLFGVNTRGGPRNIVLDGGSKPPQQVGGGFDAAFAKLLWPLV